MSNRRKRRNPRPVAGLDPDDAGIPAVAKIRGPADALAMIPYLLGLEPHESIVVVALIGPRRRLGQVIRGDLVEADAAPALVSYVASAVEANRLEAVLVVGFSARPAVADAVVPALVTVLEDAGVAVYEALRADGDRWWSYTCDSGCCPSEGTAYDPSTSSMSALAVASGMAKAPSRQALSEQFAPRDPDLRQRVSTLARAVATTVGDGDPPGVYEVEGLLLSGLGSAEIDAAGLGILLGVVQDQFVRDIAWLLITRADADLHFELWRQVMTAADDDLLAPAGALCAFAAWLNGRGALAATAADRVAEAAPDYPMLGMIRDALESGMNPDVWEDHLDALEDSVAGRLPD
jgi:hypothetical protein